MFDPSRHTGSGLSNARQEGDRRPEDRRHTGSCSCAASGMARPCARAPYYRRRGWALFAFAFVLLGFAPTSCGIFCPYIHIPGQVSGTEDGVLNMQTAWIRAATTAADKPDRAGRIWHNSDCAANNPSAESLEDGTEEAANQNLYGCSAFITTRRKLGVSKGRTHAVRALRCRGQEPTRRSISDLNCDL